MAESSIKTEYLVNPNKTTVENKLKTDRKNVLVEGFAGLLMIGAENARDMVDNPEIYGLSPNQVSDHPTNSWVFEHIGDIYETTALFSLTRVSLTAFDFAIRQVTKNKVGIPEEASFWASMAVGVIIPSLIELNQSLPINLLPSYKGDPEDLLGIGVAAVVLIGSHYSRDILEFAKSKISKKVNLNQAV